MVTVRMLQVADLVGKNLPWGGNYKSKNGIQKGNISAMNAYLKGLIC